MNEPPKQFKTTVTGLLLLLEMDEHVTALGFKCSLKVLEDVKAAVSHKHESNTGNMHMQALKLNKEYFILCTGEMITGKTVR